MFKSGKARKARDKSRDVIDYDIETSPYVVTQDGKSHAILKVDHLSWIQDELIVEGWDASSRENVLELWVDGIPHKAIYTTLARPDVEASVQVGNPALRCRGFKIMIRLSSLPYKILQLAWKITEDDSPRLFGLRVPSNAPIPGVTMQNDAILSKAVETQSSVPMSKASELLKSANWQAPDLLKLNAHLDRFGIMPQRSGLLAGWVVAQPGWELWFCDSGGNVESLDNALRYQREDIVALFRAQFGQHTVDAGFVMPWPHGLIPGAELRLVAYHAESTQAFEVSRSQPEEVSNDPEGYARWAFTVPTPAEKFGERLDRWEGKLIEQLLSERQAYFDDRSAIPDVHVLGMPAKSPTLSLIIPLYNRWDFVEHQLLAFSRDPALLKNTEILYVVDDPRILTAISNEVENLYQLYKVPFKIIWGHRNRGFSGANNLGVSLSRGRQVLLLNSDAFPVTPGWTNRLSQLLDNHPEFGMLGARLLNPEGGMQHAGMTFFYSSSWKVWLNKHPMAGLDPQFDVVPEGVEVLEKPSVTGACVIMTRELYDTVGGLDEGYLIGDFEDSDFCLKIVAAGHKVGYVPSVELVHLERQSFSALGDTSFRTLVVRFNAWRHTKRWGEQIQSVMQKFS